MKNYRLTVVIERDEDGYFGYCPQLQGCYTQENTYEEALANLRDAIKLHIEDRLEENESVPSSSEINVTSIEVMV